MNQVAETARMSRSSNARCINLLLTRARVRGIC